MDKAAVELLICPHCGGELRENGGSLICSRGHTMNIARQGYVSLLGRDAGTHTADSSEMVAARDRLLQSGAFQPLAEAVAMAAAEGKTARTAAESGIHEGAESETGGGREDGAEGSGAGEAGAGRGGETGSSGEDEAKGSREIATGNGREDEAGVGGNPVDRPGVVVDLGSGTGYYLAVVLDTLPGRIGIGVDNSKFAARRAARSHRRASAIVADIWDEIPIRDGAADLILNIFSPRNGAEIERILAPGGRLIVVTPQAGHLAELIERFGMISVDPDKEERLERSLGNMAERAASQGLEWEMNLTRNQVRDLVEMGPSAGRIDDAAMEAALGELDEETTVTAAVNITVVPARDRIM